MVNKAEQSQNDIQDVGNTTTDVTEEFAGVNTPPEGTVVPESDVESTEATPVTEEKPVTDAEGAKEAPPVSEEETPPPPPAAGDQPPLIPPDPGGAEGVVSLPPPCGLGSRTSLGGACFGPTDGGAF